MFPVTFDKVSKSYASVPVIKEISLKITENKVTVIIGRSGSGKSTLLKLVNGLLKPDSGYVKIFENKIDYNELNTLRKDIGYSVQGTALFPHMSIYENISLLARISNTSKDKINSRVLYLLNMTGLPEDYLLKYPHELSGGEQQRVGICRAMILNPKIFLLDEAFGSLDPVTKTEIHRELLQLQSEEPRTIILVTHDLAEAFHLADEVIIIEKGVIQQTGTPDEIRTKPANTFVSNYLESQKV